WIGTRCLLYQWYGNSEEINSWNSFYMLFDLYACIPLILVAPFMWYWWKGEFSFLVSPAEEAEEEGEKEADGEKDKEEEEDGSTGSAMHAGSILRQRSASVVTGGLDEVSSGAEVQVCWKEERARKDSFGTEIDNPLAMMEMRSLSMPMPVPHRVSSFKPSGRDPASDKKHITSEFEEIPLHFLTDHIEDESERPTLTRSTKMRTPGRRLSQLAEARIQSMSISRLQSVERLAAANGMTDVQVVLKQKKHTLTLYVGLLSFLLVFFHPTVSTAMLELFYCDKILLDGDTIRYWLHSDRTVECGGFQWYARAFVAGFVILTYSLGMPASLGVINYYLMSMKKVKIAGCGHMYVYSRRLELREEGRFFLKASKRPEQPEMEVFPVFRQDSTSQTVDDIEAKIDLAWYQSILGSFVLPFKRSFYYWMTYDMIRKLLQTSFVIIVEADNENWGLMYALFVSVVSLWIQGSFTPYKNSTDNWIQALVLMSQTVIMVIFVGTEFISGTDSTVSMMVNVGFIIFQVTLIMYIVNEILRQQISIHEAIIQETTRKLNRSLFSSNIMKFMKESAQTARVSFSNSWNTRRNSLSAGV
ncbi:hypothetical protein CYMTET_45961, partial [Cymbomonas tetramitiformis]